MPGEAALRAARRTLADAVASRVFPAASVEVGASDGVLWREACGTLTFDEASPPSSEHTPFDLASLTKPIATTSLVMQLLGERRCGSMNPSRPSFPSGGASTASRPPCRTFSSTHRGWPRGSSIPAEGRREFEHDICTMRLEYAPRSQSLYSDLGFMLLGFLAVDRGGASLASQFDAVRDRLADVEPDLDREPFAFSLEPAARRRAAPTLPMHDDARRGRSLAGEVHDNYAAALGGAAGHAGLFGTAAAVGAFARAVLRGARGDETVPAPLSPLSLHARRQKVACPEARARSGGTRCCRPHRAARACRRRPSATSASPARRCGSIRPAIAILFC